MKNEIIRKDTVQTFTHNEYEVRVIWIEYSGGGMGYEFEVEDAGTVIHMSEDGYGQALPAAAGAYAWVENHTNGDEPLQNEMDIEADTNFIGLDEDENQDNRLAWTHPTWIRPTGMQQAGTCPECGREGWVSLETQDISLEYGKDGHTIRIVNGFMCTDCATFWTQTIVAKVRDVISNTVEGEATA